MVVSEWEWCEGMVFIGMNLPWLLRSEVALRESSLKTFSALVTPSEGIPVASTVTDPLETFFGSDHDDHIIPFRLGLRVPSRASCENCRRCQ